MVPTTGSEIPPWFLGVLVSTFLAGLGAFSAIVVFFLKRELGRFDRILSAIPEIDKRVAIVEEKLESLEESIDLRTVIDESTEKILVSISGGKS